MRKLNYFSFYAEAKRAISLSFVLSLFALQSTSIDAQCDVIPGSLQGNVFHDVNFDGEKNNSEIGIANVLVNAFGANGSLASQGLTDYFGNYNLDNLSDEAYRIEFSYNSSYQSSFNGSANNSSVVFTDAPACNVNFALTKPSEYCQENPPIALTCFVKGAGDINNTFETIVTTEHNFSLQSGVSKFAMKSQTGSVWGLTWKSTTRELFSSAFIKQYADLTQFGHDAIFVTKLGDDGSTDLYVKLSDLGINVGTLDNTDCDDCAYGAQTGKIGLGGLTMSQDEKTLYVINIYDNTLVKLSSSNPAPSTTKSFNIPNPCSNNGAFRAFALTQHEGKIYIGVTCTGENSQLSAETSVGIFEFNPENELFNLIFTSDFAKGPWADYPSDSYNTSHWLTDLAFTDEGNIVVALSDRIAHRYCNDLSGRLDDQHPDILLVWNDNGEWKLESGAKAGTLTGSHINSSEGPGNGEFFGNDFWVNGPVYHSEIATGSLSTLRGSGSVITTVYDPDADSYTGGLHRYSTADGSKLGAAIVYSHSTDPQFGKASGLGDIVPMCDPLPIEIGNLLWVDANQNGIQDPGEEALANIEVSLYKGCENIATTSTNENGNYIFNLDNVQDLTYGTEYNIVITDEAFGNMPFAITATKIGYGANKDLNDSDAQYLDSDCEAISGLPSITIITGGSGNVDHNNDFGFFEISNSELITFYDGGIEEGCICLENATLTEEGQFGEIIRISAPSGQTWYIFQVDGLYDAEIMTMDPPTRDSFPTGVQYPLIEFELGINGYNLTEYQIGNGDSYYYLTGVRQDDTDYEIVLRSNAGDQLILNGENCSYQSHEIIGSSGACAGSIVEYCINNYNENSENLWQITEGNAEIISQNSESCVTVEFGNSPGDTVMIVFSEDTSEECYSPAMLEVVIGVGGGSLACRQNVNVSLNQYCELNLTPENILTTPINPNTVYNIVFSDLNGNMIPDNVDWSEYIGKEIMVKVMDQCSGNSCWSFIYIQDKLAPTIECFDVTISCIDMTGYNGPFAYDNCSGEAELILTGETKEAQNCDPDYSFIITRTYRAIDAYGNTSPECTQTIYVTRPDLDAIIAPSNYTVENNNPLSCDGYPTDENGFPDPIFFGVPVLEGVPLYPYSDEFCNLAVVYQDAEIPTNDCVQKIMRTWTIFEWWCTFGEMDTIIQVFNIADMADPVLICPSDFSVSSNGATCEGNVTLPAIEATDDCSSDLVVDITYPGGFLAGSNGGSISLPIGIHEVTYTVYDDCFNSSSCTIEVTVEDNASPVAVCMQNVTMGIKSDGTTYANAASFDNGSYDDCGFDRMEVRRMDNGNACGEANSGFSDQVEFCCADVGQNVVIILRVYDLAGNHNECMVNVQVQDKNPPTIACPANVTIDCLYEFDFEDMSEFGMPISEDNCMVTNVTESVFVDMNDCRTGRIIRTFVASDGNGSVSCQQIITVVNPDPFDGEDIAWPLDYETSEGCDAGTLSPDNLEAPYDYPTFTDDFCDQLAVNYQDRVYKISGANGACQKIVRTWTIQDFCQPLDGDAFRTWQYDQTITISNEVAPVFLNSCEDVTVCSFNENCATGPITLGAKASDDCTPGDMLNWSYSIDFDIDGIIDESANGKGDTITVSGEYPIGSHSVIYTFEDLCGNRSSCTQFFTIENCVGPKAACIQGISVGLEPMDTDGDNIVDNEMATVKARLLDASSFHPCNQDLIFSFSPNPADSCITFNCNDIGINEVEIYVIDETGRYDFCVTTIDVQDNNNVDICNSVEDCIIMPLDIEVTECLADFEPATLGSMPMIDPDCICTNVELDYIDTDVTPDGSTCMVIEREWSVTFTCGFPKTFTTTQTITIFNAFPPSIACPENVTVATDGALCEAFVNLPLPETSGDCSTDLIITNDSEFADSNIGAASGTYPAGTTIVTYTVTDKCGNTAQCQVSVTVTDGTPPVCTTQDITITITSAEDSVVITGEDIDLGSFDECGSIVSTSVFPNTFGCEDAGSEVLVTLTVTDDSGNSSTCTATVTINDGAAPVCQVRNTSINIVQAGTFNIPVFLINDGSFDECGEIASITINPTSVTCADLGIVDVTVTVTDDSGNSSTCIAEVRVVDGGDPICEVQDITVQLDGSDQVTITGADVDNGSSDACSGISTITVEPNTFGCENIGINDVTVTVTDEAGRSSTCTAQVTVEANDEIVCNAQDVTVYLDETGEVIISAEDVDDGSGIPCAENVTISVSPNQFFCNDTGIPIEVTLTVTDGNTSLTCNAMVTVLDTFPPIVTCPIDLTVNCQDLSDDLSIYGQPQISGNCIVLEDDIVEEVNNNLDECGLGTITRTFTATDVNGNTASCVQTITVINPDPLTEEDITWPSDTLRIVQCISINPDSLDSRPIVSNEVASCTNISIFFEDLSLTNNLNCQDTVSRIWTVVDSCSLAPGTENGIFTYEQILIINDEFAPIINAVDTIIECIPEINYIVGIEDCSDVTVSNDSEFAFEAGADISGVYPLGDTKVLITASDKCGNTSMDSILIRIEEDTIPPSFVCLTRRINIEEDGVTEVTPSDDEWFLDGQVTDNKSLRENLMFSFNRDFDMTGDTLFFTCDSVIVKSHQLMIYVKDEAGNVDSCLTSYVTADPEGFCTAGLAFIDGHVMTENLLEVPEVEMNLINGDMYEMTNESGYFAFPQMSQNNVYELKPTKDTDHMAGVSTLDLVLIQRHILGFNTLTSPYQLIAADINRNNKITAKDILDLKKNILGIVDGFPDNTSWRFVDKSYDFLDPVQPFNEVFPESFMIYNLSNPINKDFIGVKIGDVNGSIQEKDFSKVRSNGQIPFVLDNSIIEPGMIHEIPVKVGEFITLAGLQMEIDLMQGIEIVGIKAGSLEINNSDFIVNDSNSKRTLKIIHVPFKDKTLAAEEILFTLIIKSTATTRLSDALVLSRRVNSNELYNISLDIREIIFNVNSLEYGDFDKDILYQNTPNPWSEQTAISFYLEKDQHLIINIYNTTGQLVRQIERDFKAGKSEVQLRGSEFSESGVYYYEMITDTNRISKRMILIK